MIETHVLMDFWLSLCEAAGEQIKAEDINRTDVSDGKKRFRPAASFTVLGLFPPTWRESTFLWAGRSFLSTFLADAEEDKRLSEPLCCSRYFAFMFELVPPWCPRRIFKDSAGELRKDECDLHTGLNSLQELWLFTFTRTRSLSWDEKLLILIYPESSRGSFPLTFLQRFNACVCLCSGTVQDRVTLPEL